MGSKPGSKIGMIPWFSFSILIGSMSTQVTLFPISAKHAPETSPTYPDPITVIFISYFLRLPPVVLHYYCFVIPSLTRPWLTIFSFNKFSRSLFISINFLCFSLLLTATFNREIILPCSFPRPVDKRWPSRPWFLTLPGRLLSCLPAYAPWRWVQRCTLRLTLHL